MSGRGWAKGRGVEWRDGQDWDPVYLCIRTRLLDVGYTCSILLYNYYYFTGVVIVLQIDTSATAVVKVTSILVKCFWDFLLKVCCLR